MVIDTHSAFSLTQYDQYDAYVWLMKDSLAGRGDKDSEMRIVDLSQLGDQTINKEQVKMWVEMASPWLTIGGAVLVVLAVPTFYLMYLIRLLYLLIASVAIWLIGKVVGFRLTYGQSYKVGLFAMTGALIVELAVDLSEPWLRFGGFPFMFTVVTCAVAAVNLHGANRIQQPGHETVLAAPDPRERVLTAPSPHYCGQCGAERISMAAPYCHSCGARVD